MRVLPQPETAQTASKFTIPLFRPSYGEEEVAAVRECLEKGWTGSGPKVKEFEEAFAQYVGAKYAVATNSCTASLHLALQVLDIAGREVVSTPITFVSTNHAILYNNGIPVFADVTPDTLNLDPLSIEKRISSKTKVILVMHYGGHACDMDPIMELARKHRLIVVEDAAHACGGEYKGRKLGTLGLLGCFSFHAVKNLATGDGGMITTNDQSLYERLTKLRWLGINRDTWSRAARQNYQWDYDVEEVGFKYQMNDIAAAIGLVQLEKLERLNRKRKEITEHYNEAFRGLRELETPRTYPYANNAHHNYVAKTKKRDLFMSFLAEHGIATGVHYRPNNHYRMYQQEEGKTPVAERVWQTIVTLPLFPDLTEAERDHVVDSVRSFFGQRDLIR